MVSERAPGREATDGVGGADENAQDAVARHFVMVGRHCGDNRLAFPKPPDVIGADGGMGAFDFVVERLADVMKQPGPLGEGNLQAQFGGQKPGDMRDFDRVFEEVLAETMAKVQAPEQLDDFRVQRRQPRFLAPLPRRLAGWFPSISCATFWTTSSMRVG